jgi:cytochrome bd-type quinol oxidase subunit 1
MTQNQTNQLVKNPNTKKAIAVLQKFAAVEANYKAAEKEAKEATELIKNAMIEAGVPRIEVDLPDLTGYITLAERTNYKAEDLSEVPEEFTKPALDTDKVKAQHTLTGQLPVGVIESKTQYITKKFKAVE